MLDKNEEKRRQRNLGKKRRTKVFEETTNAPRRTIEALKMGRQVNPAVAEIHKATNGNRAYQLWLKAQLTKQGYPELSALVEMDKRQNIVEARIVRGVWVVFCPNPHCYGEMIDGVRHGQSQIVDDQSQIYYCLSCRNEENSHLPYLVAFPAHEDAVQLERLMARRQRAENRNWYLHETFADLVAEQKDEKEF